MVRAVIRPLTAGVKLCAPSWIALPLLNDACDWSMAAGGVAPPQVPAVQVSPKVQVLPSVHAVPSARLGLEHMPVAVSHVPASWHWSRAVHVTGFPLVHAPAWQVSDCVQALPSVQTLPSAFDGFEHVPVAVSQVPALWHWSD